MKKLLLFALIGWMSFPLLAQKKTIAVAPFELGGSEYDFDFRGTGLIEKLPTLLEAELFETGLFELVERARLDILMDEQTLGEAGLTNNEYDFGAMEGVDYFVMGKVTGYSQDNDNMKVNVGIKTMYVNSQRITLSLTIRLVDVTTAKLVSIISEEAEVVAKGKPRGNTRHDIDKSLVDKAAQQVTAQIADRIVEKMGDGEED